MERDNVHRHATPEERTFFESLLRMRTTYEHRGSADAEPVMSLRHAIATVNAEMSRTVDPHVTSLGNAPI